MIGILDSRSLGYYKTKQGVLQQNLNKFYHLKKLIKYVMNLINVRNNKGRRREVEREVSMVK